MEVHYLLPVTEELFASKSLALVISWLAINNINLQPFLNKQMSVTVEHLKLSSYYVATLFLARTTKIINNDNNNNSLYSVKG